MNSLIFKDTKSTLQNSVAFPHTDNNISQREIRETIPLMIKTNKTLRNKFNQGGKRSLHWKLECIVIFKKLKKGQIDGYISHISESGELIFFKCTYYPKPSIDAGSAWLQTILQSYSHQDSMVLAQRQKYRSMEQNRKPREKSTHLWTPYFWQRRQGYTMEKRQSL